MVKRAHESPEERQQREEQEAAAAAAAARAAELAALEGEVPPMQPSVLRCVLQVGICAGCSGVCRTACWRAGELRMLWPAV